MLSAVLDLLLPSVCPGCRLAAGPDLCPACLASLPAILHPCAWCGAPRKDAGADCAACAGRGFAHIAATTVRWHYAGAMKRLVGDAKAGARPAAARVLAALMAENVDVSLEESPPTLVVPVPPAPGRRPGPHLATGLARRLARRLGLPCRTGLLAATRFPAEQHALSATDRERNVADLFRCRAEVAGTVILVDDLVTSGATASAAAKALRATGAQRVLLCCLARTPRRGERALVAGAKPAAGTDPVDDDAESAPAGPSFF